MKRVHLCFSYFQVLIWQEEDVEFRPVQSEIRVGILSSLMLMNDWWTRIYHHRTVLFTYLIQFAGGASILNLFTGLKFESKNNTSDNSM